MVQFGQGKALATLDEKADAKGPAPDFDAAPELFTNDNGTPGTADDFLDTRWDWTPGVDDSTDRRGLLLKVVDDDNGTPLEFEDDTLAARAPFRLPIPRSLTIDQIQLFERTTTGIHREENEDVAAEVEALDFRFRLAANGADGKPYTDNTGEKRLGELAVLVHQVSTGMQLLLTRPCSGSTSDPNAKVPNVVGGGTSPMLGLVPHPTCLDNRASGSRGRRRAAGPPRVPRRHLHPLRDRRHRLPAHADLLRRLDPGRRQGAR